MAIVNSHLDGISGQRTAWQCSTWAACAGLAQSHRYSHELVAGRFLSAGLILLAFAWQAKKFRVSFFKTAISQPCGAARVQLFIDYDWVRTHLEIHTLAF